MSVDSDKGPDVYGTGNNAHASRRLAEVDPAARGNVVTVTPPEYIYLAATGGQTPIYAERALVSVMSERQVPSFAQQIRDAIQPDISLPCRVEINGVKIVLYAKMRSDRLIVIAALERRLRRR